MLRSHMPPHLIGAQIVDKVRKQGLSQCQAARELGVCRATVQLALKRWDSDGLLVALGNKGSLHVDRKLSTRVLEHLRTLVREDDALTNEEYALALKADLGNDFTADDVKRGFRELGITYKKRTQHNNRADRELQYAFQLRMWDRYTVFRFLFSDEAHFYEKGVIRTCVAEPLIQCMRSAHNVLTCMASATLLAATDHRQPRNLSLSSGPPMQQRQGATR